MIEKNTVLVLGAGASQPFGFPLGRKLAGEISGNLFEPSTTMLGKLLLDPCPPFAFTPHFLTDFASKLHGSGRDSVDAFLEHNPKFINVGRFSIVATLIPYENREAIGDGNWYRSLFEVMARNTPFVRFEQNKVAFITYNYDRSLEFYLQTTLQSAYDKNVDECHVKASSIPIIHLHGKMGAFFERNDPRLRNYEPLVNFGRVVMSAYEIKIIHESIDNNPQFAEAHRLIKDAEIVCFLGFGFDGKNLERLLKPSGILKGKKVFCSAFKEPSVKLQKAIDAIGLDVQIEWGSKDEDCLAFLQNHVVL